MVRSAQTTSRMAMVHSYAVASTLLESRWPQLHRFLDCVPMLRPSGIHSIRARHLEQVSYHGETDADRKSHGYGTFLCRCVHTA